MSQIQNRIITTKPFPGSPANDHSIVLGWLQATLNAEGWIETHRELLPWNHGEPLPVGRVLHAEWKIDENKSARIVYDGQSWVGVELVETDTEDEDFVVVCHTYLSTIKNPTQAKLCYRTAWKPVLKHCIHVLAPDTTRFAGFAKEEP